MCQLGFNKPTRISNKSHKKEMLSPKANPYEIQGNKNTKHLHTDIIANSGETLLICLPEDEIFPNGYVVWSHPKQSE